MKRLLVISLAFVLALSLSIGPLPVQPALAATTYTVDDDWQIGSPPYAEDTDGDTYFATITAALAPATSDDTIRVAAGTYNETIQLESGVEIVSDRTGDTIISGSSGFPVVAANDVTNAKLDGFTITNGSGTQSGAGIAIQSNSTNVTISNCVIVDNIANFFGGGIAVYESSASIINCTITGNTAVGLEGVTSVGNGGGIWVKNSSATIINCIITSNIAGNAGGGIYVEGAPSLTINYNDVWNNTPDNYSGCGPGTNDITPPADPQFIPEEGNYRLQSGSPCIDTGDKNTVNQFAIYQDKDGKDRIINGEVDMGAYEYGEAAPPNQPPIAEAGDNATYTLEVSQPTIEVTLNGSNSTDSDGTIVAYTWTGTPDPEDVVGPNVTLGAGVYIFTLVVTDDDGAMSDPDTVTITVKPFPVSIDIKPGSDPNSINLKSKGVVPVAILTTPDFDATMVAPDTVIFGPAEAHAEKSALEDVNDDGELDMILHFRTQEIGLTEADTEATLYGQTEARLSIIGVDTVSIVPPSDTGKGNKN